MGLGRQTETRMCERGQVQAPKAECLPHAVRMGVWGSPPGAGPSGLVCAG